MDKDKYKHIFFDLDHTLWDFDRNAREVLSGLYTKYQLQEHHPDFEVFMQTYYQTTHQLWTWYNQQQITQAQIRELRFKMIFQQLQIPIELIDHHSLSEEYLYLTPRQPHLLPHTLEVLEYLKTKYQLHIITNGFPEIQDLKLSSSGIQHFFPYVFTSANAGVQKPHKQIFLYALSTTGANPKDALMIGDNYDTDVKGAQGAGLDAIFFNPKKIPIDGYQGKQIACLSELYVLL